MDNMTNTNKDEDFLVLNEVDNSSDDMIIELNDDVASSVSETISFDSDTEVGWVQITSDTKEDSDIELTVSDVDNDWIELLDLWDTTEETKEEMVDFGLWDTTEEAKEELVDLWLSDATNTEDIDLFWDSEEKVETTDNLFWESNDSNKEDIDLFWDSEEKDDSTDDLFWNTETDSAVSDEESLDIKDELKVEETIEPANNIDYNTDTIIEEAITRLWTRKEQVLTLKGSKEEEIKNIDEQINELKDLKKAKKEEIKEFDSEVKTIDSKIELFKAA